jgi:hypothetical protein
MPRSAKYNTENHRRITVRILTTTYEDLNLIKVFILLSGKGQLSGKGRKEGAYI